MIQQVFDRIYIADMEGCRSPEIQGKMATRIHACKIPCHQQAVGYIGSLPDDHPHYLHVSVHDPYLGRNELYLNLVDPPVPLFKLESFNIFLDYTEAAYADSQNIIIHCNQGKSRAPTLALLFAIKRLKIFPHETFDEARKEFEKLYPDYAPGNGIVVWMQRNWEKIE